MTQADLLLTGAATIRGDLRDLMIAGLVHQTKLWRDMPQAEQIEKAKQIDSAAADLVTRIAILVATQGRPSVLATLDRVTVDAEARAILLVPKDTVGALVSQTKQIVAIMTPGAHQFMGERSAVQTMPDQPALPMQPGPAVQAAAPVRHDHIDALYGPNEKTLPEPLATLQLQQKALIEGRRPAQMFPTGTAELSLPLGMERIVTERGVFHFNPEELDPVSIIAKSAEARENDLLGMGPYSKIDVVSSGQPAICVVERAPDGMEIVAALTIEPWAEEVMAVMERGKATDSTLAIEPVEAVIVSRIKALEAASAPAPITEPPKIITIVRPETTPAPRRRGPAKKAKRAKKPGPKPNGHATELKSAAPVKKTTGSPFQ